MTNALERHRKTWVDKSDEWLFERLDNELKSKLEEIHRLLEENHRLSLENEELRKSNHINYPDETNI